MDTNRYFIRVDSEGLVVDGYAEWEETKRAPDEIEIFGDYGRHFPVEINNERGQKRYRYVNGEVLARVQSELDAEWMARPPEPPTYENRLQALEDAMTAMLGL